jgi:hypothetical protein
MAEEDMVMEEMVTTTFNPDILVNRFDLLIRLVAAMNEVGAEDAILLERACELTLRSIEEGMSHKTQELFH